MWSILSQRFDFVKKVPLTLAGVILFCGCSIHSKSPSDRAQNNLNAPSPTATIESSQQSAEEVNAVRLVSAAIESNKLNVTSNDLKAKKNPKADGVFVYVPQTRYSGVERYVIWMVVDSKPYALNSPFQDCHSITALAERC